MFSKKLNKQLDKYHLLNHYFYKAWNEGKEFAPLWDDAKTIAAGIRVPVAVGDFLIIRAVNESNGFSITVSDNEIVNARDEISGSEGTLLCPEGAATFAAYKKSLSSNLVSKNESVVLFNCATGLKYQLPEVSNYINKNDPIDYSNF